MEYLDNAFDYAQEVFESANELFSKYDPFKFPVAEASELDLPSCMTIPPPLSPSSQQPLYSSTVDKATVAAGGYTGAQIGVNVGGPVGGFVGAVGGVAITSLGIGNKEAIAGVASSAVNSAGFQSMSEILSGDSETLTIR